MSECQHDAVMTYSGVGAGRMWACEDCKLRLYPACRECVVDGHRSGEHPPARADVDGLVALRPVIAKAIVEHYRIYDFHEVWTERGALHLLEHCIEPAILAGDKAEAPE